MQIKKYQSWTESRVGYTVLIKRLTVALSEITKVHEVIIGELRTGSFPADGNGQTSAPTMDSEPTQPVDHYYDDGGLKLSMAISKFKGWKDNSTPEYWEGFLVWFNQLNDDDIERMCIEAEKLGYDIRPTTNS